MDSRFKKRIPGSIRGRLILNFFFFPYKINVKEKKNLPRWWWEMKRAKFHIAMIWRDLFVKITDRPQLSGNCIVEIVLPTPKLIMLLYRLSSTSDSVRKLEVRLCMEPVSNHCWASCSRQDASKQKK